MIRQSPFRQTLNIYYLHVFCYDFIFGYAIFPAYFQLQGSSPELIGGILAFWAAGIIVFEIPTGLFSDLIDRRFLLILAPACKAICFLIWIFADGHVGYYFLGMAFWSLASALRTGSKEAWLYEHVSSHGRPGEYTTILGRERGIQDAATLLGAAIGGVFAGLNLQLAFWMSTIPLTVCAVSGGFLKDVRTVRLSTEATPISLVPGLLKSALQDYFSKPQVRYATLYIMLCVTCLSTLEDFNQLFLLAIKMPVWSIGITIAAMGAARALMSFFSGRFERLGWISWVFPALSGGALLASGFFPSAFALVALALAYILIAPLLVLSMSRFQHAIASTSRATSTSLMSMLIESLSVVFNVLIAILFSVLTVIETYQVCGLYLVVFALWDWFQTRPKTGSS